MPIQMSLPLSYGPADRSADLGTARRPTTRRRARQAGPIDRQNRRGRTGPGGIQPGLTTTKSPRSASASRRHRLVPRICSAAQVEYHRESTARQYALAERAAACRSVWSGVRRTARCVATPTPQGKRRHPQRFRALCRTAGSARRVWLGLHTEGLNFPLRLNQADEIRWTPPVPIPPSTRSSPTRWLRAPPPMEKREANVISRQSGAKS